MPLRRSLVRTSLQRSQALPASSEAPTKNPRVNTGTVCERRYQVRRVKTTLLPSSCSLR